VLHNSKHGAPCRIAAKLSLNRKLAFSILVMCVFTLTSEVSAQTMPQRPESPEISALATRIGNNDSTALSGFWSVVGQRHTPLIEALPGDPKHVLATFIWRGDASTTDVVLMAQPNGVEMLHDSRSHLHRLLSTDLWYVTHRLPIDAEFSYLFAINPPSVAPVGPFANANVTVRLTTVADPLNPLQYRILTGPSRSIARMPAVPEDPWLGTSVDPADVREYTLHSTVLTGAGDRKVWVFMTPGDLHSPNLILMLDSDIYMRAVPSTAILSKLYSAGKIRPTVAVFIGGGDGKTWLSDHYFNETYVCFLADEVVPWAERELHFKADRRHTVIAGESIEGLTASFAALIRPDIFGNVISQSGSFWINNHENDNGEPEWLARQFAKSKPLDVFFCLDVGQMEFTRNDGDRIFTPFIPGETNLLASNRHLRDVLTAKGYKLFYSEVYGGHEPLRWTRTLPHLLLATLSR